jgi:hypothetical protein
MKRGGKESHVGLFLPSFSEVFLESFPLFFELFWQALHYGSRCGFGASGLAWFLGLI